MFRKAILTASTAIFAAGSAAAATSATAVTDLNLRAGPGPQYEIIGVIDAEAKASVDGCIEESNWCKVTYDGQEGWAYGNYLTAMVEETPTAVIAPEVTVGTVTYDSSKDGEAFAGAGTVGAVAGALVAGPIGAVGGGRCDPRRYRWLAAPVPVHGVQPVVGAGHASLPGVFRKRDRTGIECRVVRRV